MGGPGMGTEVGNGEGAEVGTTAGSPTVPTNPASSIMSDVIFAFMSDVIFAVNTRGRVGVWHLIRPQRVSVQRCIDFFPVETRPGGGSWNEERSMLLSEPRPFVI